MSSIDKFLTQHTAQPDLNKAAKYSPLPSSELALTSQVDFIDEEGWFGPGYNTYVKRFNPTGDPVQDQRILDDLRYQNQGYAMRILNTAPRFIGTLGAYVGEGLGVVGGLVTDVLLGGADIAKDLTTGREVEWKDFGYTFDNIAISAMETVAEGTKALFPNYASANYQDQGFLDRITSTEFILNELVDGLAFLGSAFVGGTGVLKGIGAVGKLTKGLKVGQAVQKEMALIRAAERAGKKLTAFQKVLKNTPNAMVTAVNTIAESGIEAHGVKKELMRSYENGEWGTNLTAKEAEIEATERASESFKMNALLLVATGFLETDMLFGKSVLSRANVKDALAGKRITERFITPKVFLNAGNEALQEGIQTSIERYETNLLTGRDEVVPRSRYHKDGWLSGAANVLEEFLDGTRNTAQQSAMFIGALLGSGGSYISSKARENSLNKDFQRLLRNTRNMGDNYNKDYEKLFEEEEIEEPVIDPNTGKQAMKGTTPVTQKIKRFKRDANGNLVYNNEVIERKLFHLRRDRNTLQEAKLAVLRGEDEIGDLVSLTHLARLANFWFEQDHGDLILRSKLEKIAQEETAKAGSSGANTIMLALSKNLDAVDKLKDAYDNIQKDVITNSKNRENEEAFSKDKSAALLYEEAKRIFLNRLLNNGNVAPHLNTPLTNNSFYNRFLSFFGISKSPQTQAPTTQQPTTQQPTTQQPTTQQPTTQQPTTQQSISNVPTLKDSIESALKDSAEFSKRLLESDDDVYAEWENLLNERKGLKDSTTAAQARFNLTKDLQSYRDLMLEEGYFDADKDTVLQQIRRHTAKTVKRNTELEDYLNGKLQTQMGVNESFELTKFLSTLRDLSQINIQQAEQLRHSSLTEKGLSLRDIEAEIGSKLLEIQKLEDLINELEALAAFKTPDYVEVDFSALPIELQKEAEALITSLGSEVEEVNFYSNTSVQGVTEYIAKIAKTGGNALIISYVNGKLLPTIEMFNSDISISMIVARNQLLQNEKGTLALRNDKAVELKNLAAKVEDEIEFLKNADFTQNSEEFRMANLSEDDLPAAVKDFLIKRDIEKGKEVLKTETENFNNGIYSVTVLKKMIDYVNLLLKYPSLGANEPEVLQLLADLTTLFNAVDAAFKKQIAEGKKFMDEHENSITEYLNEFSSDPNKPVFIEILTELKRLRDVATNPASDPNDAQLAKDKIAQKLIALNELIHTSVFSDIIEELHDFLIPRGASIDEALTEILTRKSTSAKPLTSAERKDKNKNLLSYHSSYRFFQGLIKGIPFLNTYLISDRIDFKEFEQLVNSMTINDIEFTTVPSQAEFDAFKAKLLAFFNEYRKLRKIEKAINFLNSGVDLTELYKNAPMPTVFPSPQQQVVMEEALAYLTKGRTKEAFVIDGAAGTGKTFLLNQFLGTTKVLTWSPYQHADENLKQTLNVETTLGTVEDLIKEVLPSSVSSRDIEGKFAYVKDRVDEILADKIHPLYNMVSQLQIGMPLIVDEIYAADIDTQIVLTVLAKDFGAKVILLGDPNQISNLHGLAKYSWGFVTAYTRHATPLSVRFRSFVLPIAATQEAFYGKTSAITEVYTSHNDELGVKGFDDASDLLLDIKTKLKNGVSAADCKVIVSKDLLTKYINEFKNQGLAIEVLSVEESQGREFPYVWVDITKINVSGIVQETAHNKLVYTALSRGKKYIGYNNAKGSSIDTRTQIISSFDASLTEDTAFKNLLFAANEKTYLELLQRRNAPSSRPIPVLHSLGSPIVPPTVVPLPTTPTVPVTPQRTSLLNSVLNKGKIVLNFLKNLKTVIANKINNQTLPPATNNTTTNPPPNNQTPPVPPTTNTPIPPNNQTTPVPPTTNIPVTNTPIPPTTNTPVLDYLINKTPIKAGVEELFESNPELAKSVYESLGFNKNVDLSLNLLTTTEIILNGTNKKLNYSSNDIITGEETLKEIKGNFNIKRDAGSRFDLYKGDTKIANFKIVTDENDFIIDDISTVRNIRRQGVITFLIRALSRSNEMKHGKTLKIRTNILKQDGKSLLDSLEKKGIGFYTTDDLFQISPTNLFAQITPQQKQQALQLYSQYLDTIFPDSKVEEMDDNLYNSVLNQLEQENKIDKDCNGVGKLKAEKGLATSFVKGGKWKVIKDLKGYPTHKEGGVDLTIGKDGVSIKNGNTQFTAKYGLVIPKAQDGSWFPSWMNPHNWGVTDYTDKGDFNTAYSSARKSGEKEFLFNGKRYNTDYKGTPQQQLKETGLTNKQITGSRKLKRMYKNTTPYTSILPPLIQGLKGYAGFEDKNRDIDVENPFPIAYYLENNQKVFRDLPEEEQKRYKELSKPYFKRADDAWALYTGNSQRFKTFEISNHKPSNSKNKDDYYYSLNKSYPELLEFIEKEGINLKIGESKQVEEPTRLVLRNFKIGRGQDEKGDYISYYDIWNLNPSFEFPIPEQGKPFEIYDRIYVKDYGDGKQKRMYYSDKELSELDVNKKNFDTLALQKELANRGVKFEKSIKKDGSFDGVFGNETKQALLNYQIKNKSK